MGESHLSKFVRDEILMLVLMMALILLLIFGTQQAGGL